VRIALTFDDGPATWTAPILDLLVDHAKATFFVCGHAVAAHKELLRLAAFDGHEIGNHTFNHPRLTTLSDEDVERELTMTSEEIYAVLGDYPSLWRAPHFDTDERVNRIATELGMTHVGCTLDPGDWMNTAERIVARVSQAKDNDIVDLHDGIPPDGGTGAPTRQATVDALPHILALDAEFVTVTELWTSAAA